MTYANVRRGGKPIEAAEEYLAADKPISIDDIAAGVTMADPNKSARALAEFEREFGPRVSARNERWRNSRHSITTQPIA